MNETQNAIGELMFEQILNFSLECIKIRIWTTNFIALHVPMEIEELIS